MIEIKNLIIKRMRFVKKINSLWLLICMLLMVLQNQNGQQPAFPGAEGFGKYTKGGRGGIVIEVTNLNDSGTGSLRNALTSYKGQKRTIVFRVSGNIELSSPIEIKYDSCITIAGQTAPGDGICLKNYPVVINESKDIIIRYIRSRLGDMQNCGTNCDLDALSVRKSHHIIIDHCSLSWSIDAVLDLTVETGYSTVQYCILSEALRYSKHSKSGGHSMAAGWDGNSHGKNGVFAGGSYHHNLIASCNSRTPRIDSYAGENNTGERDLVDIVNNVVYNWSGYGAYGGEHADINWQNNYYKYGPETNKKYQIFQADGEAKMYLEGNYVDGYPHVTEDNSKGIYILGSPATAIQLNNLLVKSPFNVWPVEIQKAEKAYNNVLAGTGAFLPARDAVDHRIINDVKNRTGEIIDSQNEVGGWPQLKSEAAPVDSDKDGMPDVWEEANNLDKNNAGDRNNIAPNGYTMLEIYLNSIEFDNAVENINYTLVEDGKIKISWDDSFIGEDSFIIERSENGADFKVIASVSRNIDEYTDNTFQQYDNIRYRVKAFQEDSIFSPEPSEVIITGLELLVDEIIHVGDTLLIGISVSPENATNRIIRWELRTEDTDIAGIDQNGRLIAKKEGTIVVTATTLDGSNIKATKQITIDKILLSDDPSPVENREIIKCFPNPSSNGYFNIELSSSINDENILIVVTDLSGRDLYYENFHNKRNFMLKPDLSEGIYILNVLINRERIIEKLIVVE